MITDPCSRIYQHDKLIHVCPTWCAVSLPYTCNISQTDGTIMYTQCNMKQTNKGGRFDFHVLHYCSNFFFYISSGARCFLHRWMEHMLGTLDTEEVAKRAEGSLDFGVLCQRVDGVHRRMELQTGTEVQLPDVSPGSRVLANEGAVLIKRYLPPFAVVHQTVVTIWSPHHRLHGWLSPLKPLFLLTWKILEVYMSALEDKEGGEKLFYIYIYIKFTCTYRRG